MGSKLKCSLAIIENMDKSSIPTIICNLPKHYLANVIGISDETISLNLLLAQKLLKFKVEERSDVVHQEAMDILMLNKTSLFLKDFEMLFDPHYKIDVVRLIYEVSRRRKIIALWPGTVSENDLIYANSESPDYQIYSINNYDIICVC